MRPQRSLTSDVIQSRKSSQEWDVAKLLELGVDPKFVSKLKPAQLRDMAKGLVYLSERYVSQS